MKKHRDSGKRSVPIPKTYLKDWQRQYYAAHPNESPNEPPPAKKVTPHERAFLKTIHPKRRGYRPLKHAHPKGEHHWHYRGHHKANPDFPEPKPITRNAFLDSPHSGRVNPTKVKIRLVLWDP